MGFINKHCLAWAGGPGGVTAIFECNYLLEVKVNVMISGAPHRAFFAEAPKVAKMMFLLCF